MNHDRNYRRRKGIRRVLWNGSVDLRRRVLLFEPLECRRLLADFGDAPASYSTTLAANGPRHQNTATLFFGTNAATDVDSEADGQPSNFADADEINGQFDEQGISGQAGQFSALAITPGTTANVFVTASVAGLLDAFIDFNDDGDFADAGEKIFSSQTLTAGQNSLTFAVPAAATGGGNSLTFGRWRISSAGGLSFTGDAANGEVEDHSIDVVGAQVQLDFGDAPNSYGTTLAANGARHTLANPFLGAARDGEGDGQPSSGANGDDTTGVPDDEDGVTIGDITQGTTASVAVISSANFAELDAFVDFNIDGDFADAGEKIFTSTQLNAGTNNLTFNVPANATVGNTFARFRSSFAGGLSFNGQATGGEVEDYAIRIVSSAPPPCTFVVTTPNDTVNANDAVNSLREAILCANNTAGTDTITFNIPGAGPHRISPATELPAIDEATILDGLTQPGSACNTTVSTLRIELNGDFAGANTSGLTVTGGNTTIRGLVINRFSEHGILLQNVGDNIVECNFIGLNVEGTANLGNTEHGVFVDNTSNNRIGGETRSSRNVISGNNDAGVSIVGRQATGNRVIGNYIGTDATGTVAIGNTEGVEIYNASNNAVGAETLTPGTGPGNVISGNEGIGVEIASGVQASAFDNRIFGNIIGLNVTGTAALPNAVHGVAILDAFDNQVGLAGTVGTRNIISANRGAGVFVDDGTDPAAAVDNEIGSNFIGTDITGALDFQNIDAGIYLQSSRTLVDRNVIAFNNLVTGAGVTILRSDSIGNRITNNSMFSNVGLGINLDGGTQDANRVTLNDAGDADSGPNDLFNFPILSTATISGTNLILEGFARPGSVIELFVAAPDPSGFGEGRTFLITLTEGAAADTDTGTGTYGPGAINGTNQGTDTTNRFRFTFPTPAGVSIGTVLTSTATDANNNTSEFSGNTTVQGALDFGDAPDSYGTTLAANGARHTIANPFLGAARDAEADGQPTTGATGDDVAGAPDDEDGVTISDITQGTTANVTVFSSANFAELDAFVDFNIDGDFADVGEKIFASTQLSAGNNSLTFNVPAAATLGNTFARFRISFTGGLSFNGQATEGEVEDYAIRIVSAAVPTFDFGDAPNTYLTTLAANGPRHRLGSALFFGTNAAADVDSEADGQPSAFADADETTGQFDETGISEQSNSFAALTITPGTTATVFVTASASGLLDAFLDFNDDGDFADAGEKIFSSQSLVAGVNTLTFTVPGSATGGADNLTFGRWRISSTGGLSFTGEATDGEVEDHSVDVVAAAGPATISGLKFIDTNGNGRRDGQEAGQAGVTIFLDADNDGQLDVPGETSTTTAVDDPATPANETGTYVFGNLQPAAYSVCEVPPANTIPTLPAGARPCFTVTLTAGQQRTGLDFGNQPVDPNASNSFAGIVYADVNDNGIKDSQEVSLPNVTLTLTGPVTRTVKTDQNGAYRFSNLPSGVYSVAQSQPAAFLDGKETKGAPDLGNVADDAFVLLNLAGNINASDYNFGERGLVQQLISKRLFLASTPLPAQAVGVIQAQGEGEWFSMRATSAGVLQARPTSATTIVELYTSSFLPLGKSLPGQSLSAPVGEGESVVVYVQSDEANTSVEMQIMQWNAASAVDLAADATNDGAISPLDALVVINELNSRQYSDSMGRMLNSSDAAEAFANFDTNTDGFVTAVDALRIINLINAQHRSAEGESASVIFGPLPSGESDLNGSDEQKESKVATTEMHRSPLLARAQPAETTADCRTESVDLTRCVDQALAEYLAECLRNPN